MIFAALLAIVEAVILTPLTALLPSGTLDVGGLGSSIGSWVDTIDAVLPIDSAMYAVSILCQLGLALIPIAGLLWIFRLVKP